MIVYRICVTYPPDHDPIDGKGAFKHGGRWNSKGTYAVYTASSIALARCELARHVNMESIPDDLKIYVIELPDADYPIPEHIPEDWKSDPETQRTKTFGDQLLQKEELLCFKVPSVCDPHSFNYILNPICSTYHQVKVKEVLPFNP